MNEWVKNSHVPGCTTGMNSLCKDPAKQKHTKKDPASFQERMQKSMANEITEKCREGRPAGLYTKGPAGMKASNPISDSSVHQSCLCTTVDFNDQQDTL